MITEAQEQFIQHELKIRLLKERSEDHKSESNSRFERMEFRFERMIEKMDKMDKTLTSLSVQFKIISAVIGLIAIPVLLHYFKVT